jgi:hypothetical protein
MAGSFDSKSKSPGSAGQRPAPTIEGTATEVAFESEMEVAAKDEAPAAAKDAAAPEAGGAETTAEIGDKDEPEMAAAPQPPRSRGSGFKSFLSHLTAGLLGGLAGAGALALAWGHLPMDEPAPGPDVTSLENRVAKLEATPDTPGDATALAKLEDRIGELEGRKPETPPEVTALADRVSQLETSLKSMAEAAKDGGSVADAAAISQQIGEAEQRLEAKIDGALAESKTADAASLEAMQKEIAAIEAKLKALAEAEFGSGDAAQLVPEMAALSERLGKLEAAIPRLADAVDQDAAETRSATLAIAFANLRAAVAEGRPYAAELATLAALSPGAGDLGALLDYDDKGIPTLPELTRSFRVAKDAALAAAAPEVEGSLLDRFLASAESMIKVRRVDAEAKGDEPDAVLARAEAALDQGDLAATVKEVETLNGAPRAAFAAWLDQAHARLGADAALQKLENILLVSLSDDVSPGQSQTDQSGQDQTDEQD